MKPDIQWVFWLIFCLLILSSQLTRGVVRLIQEQGYRDGSFFYHLGDNGHAYHYNSQYKGSIYFKCVKFDDGCRGRAILHNLGANGFSHRGHHTCLPNPDLVEQRAYHRSVMNTCREQKWVSYRQILDNHRSDRRYSRRVRARMTLPRLRSSMRRARLQTYPEIPQSLQELTAALHDDDNAHILQTEGDDSIYAGSVTAADGSHHLIFMSEEQKAMIGDVDVLHADGTFKSRPATPQSSQLFCIVTTWETHVIPLCWVLMERRTIAAYRAVFHFLKQTTDIDPSKIITDFEYSQQRAWQLEFPRARIQGCLYHLCNAFIKKCKRLRLMRYVRYYPNLKTILMKTVAISLLPPRYFERALRLIMRDAERENAEEHYLMRHFFTYVRDSWIRNPQRRPWMVFFNSVERTNNACESHNRMLRNKVGAHRPNVWAFIEALKVLENNANLDVYALGEEGVEVSRARRWTSVVTDAQLQRLTRNLREGLLLRNRDFAIRSFIARAAHINHRVVNNLLPE